MNEEVTLGYTGGWPQELPVEVYFLKYAFPCAFISLQRGRIDQSEYEMLEDAAINNRVIPKEQLEEVFVPAIRRMKRLADKMDLDVWSRVLLEEYYIKQHNQIIDEGIEDYAHAPEVLRELCKVRMAEIIEVKGDLAVAKLENGKDRAVQSDLVGMLKVGDKVMVHYGYVVEKLSS